MIDKSIYQAPVGIDALADGGDELEVEIVDDPADSDLHMPPGGENQTPEFAANLCETLDEADLTAMISELAASIDNDKMSRKDWERTYKDGLKLLGLKTEERTEPWSGACGVVHPMLAEAVVRFQAECVTETFPAAGPVRTHILGKETPEKKEAAQRVEQDMNWELTENMPEFRGEHERMLFELPGAGCTFKKVYYDPSLGRQTSVFVPAEDVILPYGTTNLTTCYRLTHVMRKTEDEIVKLQESGFYASVPIGSPTKTVDDIKQAKDRETGFNDLNDERFILHEVLVDCVIKGDPLRDEGSQAAYPYVITYIKDTETVLSIRRNWREEDKLRRKRQHFVQYDYIPGFGAYGLGLFHLIGGYAGGATSLIRQLIDAGTLSNLPGGLKSRGLRIKGDDTPIAPGEFRDVDIGSGNIRDNIMPLPYKEPSVVLAGLLDKIVEEGRRFAATADMQISDMSAQAPVGTTLALIERQLKVMSAVQARVHNSLKQELKLLRDIIRDYTPDEYTYDPESGTRNAKKADYDTTDVLPVSDPSAATMAQRVVQHQAAIQMAQMAPEIYDLPHLHREMLETLGFKNANKIVPVEEDLKACDPVTENMDILRSKPIKAFMHQDHAAHLAVHNAMLQDPSVMQALGQNPKAQMMLAGLQAHIAEHMAYDYRKKIEAALGIVLPPEGEELPPQVETALSQMMAQAAMVVQQQGQMQAAAQAAQQAAQDPMVQLQQAELAVKQQKNAIDDKKVVIDAAYKQDLLDLQEREMQAKYELEGVKAGHQIAQSKQQNRASELQSGVKSGVEIAKIKQQGEQHDRQMTEQRIAGDKQAADKRDSEERAAAQKPAAPAKKAKK
jgi:hypothetical protein